MKNSLLTVIAFFLFGDFSSAQSVEMNAFGAAEGSQIERFEINERGDILAVQESGEFFLSENDGLEWEPVAESSGGVFNSLIHHPDGSFLYVGKDNSIYKILPEGGEAQKLFILPGLNFNSVLAVTVDDAGDLFALNFGQLYKSEDIGETWTKIFNPKVSNSRIISAYDEDLTAFSGSDYLYLRRYEISLSGAVRFAIYRISKTNLSIRKIYESPNRITKMIRHSTGELIIATHEGAFAADETGLKWNQIAGSEKQFSNVAEGANGELIFTERTGFYIATSIGAPLNSMTLPNPGGQIPGTKIEWNDTKNEYFVLQKNASANNFFRAESDFGNWNSLTPGKRILATSEIAFKSRANSVFIKSNTGTDGYFVSKNGGKRFYPFLVNGKLSIRNLAKGVRTKLYAIAEDDKIYSTVNEGKRWVSVKAPAEVQGTNSKPFLLKTGPFGELLTGYYDNNSKLFYSKDGGQSWSKISESEVGTSQVAFHPSGDVFGLFYPTAYVRPTDSAELRRFTPSSGNWSNVRAVQGVASDFKISDKGLIHLKSATSDTELRTYISDDSGETLRESQLPDFYFAPNGLLFAISGQDVVLSKNIGETWEVIYTHDRDIHYRNLYLDFENYLYAVFESGPVYRSDEPIFENNFITGNVFIDANGNCEQDPREKHFPGAIIKAEGVGEFYAMTDEDGRFSIPVFEDNYEVSVRFNDKYWKPCKSFSAVSLSGSNNSIEVNIPLQPAVECPGMEVNLIAPEIKKCEESIFQVKYANKGTIKAEDAIVEIELNPDFSIVESELVWTQLAPGLYEFEIGDPDVFEEGNFEFTVGPICDPTHLGQPICTGARVFPNDVCNPGTSDWSGASLQVEGECVGEKMAFRIKNVGWGDMIIPRQFIIIEDVALLRDPEYFAIQAGGTVEFLVTPDGQSIQVSVEQAIGHPGHSNPSVTLESCLDSSTDNASQQEVSGGLEPTEKEVCQQAIDWNLKSEVSGMPGTKSGRGTTDFEVIIAPNPFSEFAVLSINSFSEGDSSNEYHLNVYDLTGKVVSSQMIENQEVRIERKGMDSGFYFYKVLNKNQLIASGKLVIE